jgi:hypothetical protein
MAGNLFLQPTAGDANSSLQILHLQPHSGLQIKQLVTILQSNFGCKLYFKIKKYLIPNKINKFKFKININYIFNYLK